MRPLSISYQLSMCAKRTMNNNHLQLLHTSNRRYPRYLLTVYRIIWTRALGAPVCGMLSTYISSIADILIGMLIRFNGSRMTLPVFSWPAKRKAVHDAQARSSLSHSDIKRLPSVYASTVTLVNHSHLRLHIPIVPQ